MEVSVGMNGAVGLHAGSWLLALACCLLLGIVALLAGLWFRARHRLQEVHSDLRNLQQQVIGLSEQLREADLKRQRECQPPTAQQQQLEQQGGVGPEQLVSASLCEEVLEPLKEATFLNLKSKESAVGSDDAIAEQSLQKPDVSGPVAVETGDVPLSPADARLLAQVHSYIDQQLSHPSLSVEEVSEALGISRVYLYKKLTALTGRTPIEYIRYLRLQRAEELLRTTALPIGEIGGKVGIQNPKKFSHYFKKEYGMVPSVYQRTFL